ncbi:MAG TPA: DUF692 domain-containing protein [Usitatibacter sp.]|jgi:hypothetical protein|nr:DUF692 domain-containing protein [Usitatibacter sp.]
MTALTSLPLDAGIGLRAPHVAHVLRQRPAVPWFEVHSENYFAEGGAALASLERVRAKWPVSLHGVGLSLGSTDPLDRAHLAKLQRLAARIEPAAVSEHLCWSSIAGRHFNDLLPLPCTREALDHVSARVSEVQETLGRPILVENISSYWLFPEEAMPEPDFLAELARRTGCGVLLDVNNLYVNELNHGLDAAAYIAAVPPCIVGEIHLAGFDASGRWVIDTHGAPVAAEVWSLYEAALARFGPVPTLIEWDTDLPEFAVLEREAVIARACQQRRNALAA